MGAPVEARGDEPEATTAPDPLGCPLCGGNNPSASFDYGSWRPSARCWGWGEREVRYRTSFSQKIAQVLLKGSQRAHSKLVTENESCSTVPLGQYHDPGDDR
jgi:hypothetical protein